jgi:hypothetical protein
MDQQESRTKPLTDIPCQDFYQQHVGGQLQLGIAGKELFIRETIRFVIEN